MMNQIVPIALTLNMSILIVPLNDNLPGNKD